MTYDVTLPLVGNFSNKKKPDMPATDAPDLQSLLNQALGAVTDKPAKSALSNMESGHSSLEGGSTATSSGSSLPELNWPLIGIVGAGLLLVFWWLKR